LVVYWSFLCTKITLLSFKPAARPLLTGLKYTLDKVVGSGIYHYLYIPVEHRA
jgi:hypothetical protein